MLFQDPEEEVQILYIKYSYSISHISFIPAQLVVVSCVFQHTWLKNMTENITNVHQTGEFP